MYRPRALILDDDSDFSFSLKYWLAHKKFDVKEFNDIGKFISAAKCEKSDVFFIDLNIASPKDGLSVVQVLRKDLHTNAPIFMVSSTKNEITFENALSFGVNDYLVKPLEREILVNRLFKYFKSTEHDFEPKDLLPEACIESKVYLHVHFDIAEIDEFGATLFSDHFVPKDTLIPVETNLFEEITGLSKLFLSISTIEWEPNSKRLKYYATFDASNEAILSAVRRWLLLREKIGGRHG